MDNQVRSATLSILITPSLYEQFKRIAKQRGSKSVSDLGNEVIERFVNYNIEKMIFENEPLIKKLRNTLELEHGLQ